MAIQLITVAASVGRLDPSEVESATRRPLSLPAVFYSSWVDTWSPAQLFARVLRKKSIEKDSVIHILLRNRDFKRIEARLRRQVKTICALEPIVGKFYVEILAAIKAVKRWKGIVIVTIRIAGASRYDDDIARYMHRSSASRTRRREEHDRT